MKIITTLLLIIVLIPYSIAYNESDLTAANFLAKKRIIKNWGLAPERFLLDDKISRREMLKVTINLSGLNIDNDCEGVFEDIKAFDWGCKYAEKALKANFIASNKYFRPDDNITKIESLKLIMKSRNLYKYNASDWRVGYVEGAIEIGILEESFYDFDALATRSWIFEISANTFPEYQTEEEEILEILGEIIK